MGQARALQFAVFSLGTLLLVLGLLLPKSAGFAQGSDSGPELRVVQQQAWNVQFVDQTGGPTHAVAVQGEYAHIGVGYRLVVLDISDPAQPIPIGQTPVLTEPVLDVAVAGDFSYVLSGTRVASLTDPYRSVLRIVDISDPADPRVVGGLQWADSASAVHVASSYAYIAAGRTGFRIVDVSDPAAPMEVAVYADSYATDVYVDGSYAYVAAYDAGLHVVDVSSPSAPMGVAAYDTMALVQGVHVVGNYAYVANGADGLAVVDVSDPAAPLGVGGYDPQQRSYKDLVVAGGHAYVVADVSVPWEDSFLDVQRAGLEVVDVRNPAEPLERSLWLTPGEAEGIAVAGDHAFVADGRAGLRVANVQDPAAPTEVGAYDLVGSARKLDIPGDPSTKDLVQPFVNSLRVSVRVARQCRTIG